MKDEKQGGLDVGWRPEHVTSLTAGGQVTILVRGTPVLGFSSKDRAHRDIVVATLCQADLPGKQVARLCGVSESEVTRVRQRYAAGGMSALAARPYHGGIAKVISAKQRKRIEELRKSGKSIEAIARATKAPIVRVREVLNAAGLGTARARRPAPPVQLELGENDERAESGAEESPKERRAARAATLAANEDDALRPGYPIASSAKEHRSRYAGLVLLSGQLEELGLGAALTACGATRGDRAVYTSAAIATTLTAAFAAGYSSIESMHERDAHSLGLVLGYERCPSVRTLHRALAQMLRSFDPVRFGVELMRGVHTTRVTTPCVFGVDGHFKPYAGKAPIDKGWNSKKRLAQKGLLDIVTTDLEGRTWLRQSVNAGDGLACHLPGVARRLRSVLGDNAPLCLAFDRGGFDFDVLAALDAANVRYVAWVPASVKLPPLDAIAPSTDGIGEAAFVHERMRHASRLLVQRDADALVPACTNLGTDTDAASAIALLRAARGMQENAFKAARAHMHIDHLSDRGVASLEPDTRLCDNPAYVELKSRLDAVDALVEQIESCPERCVQNGDWTDEYVFADLRQKTLRKKLRATPARVERRALEPDAMRAFLHTRRRELVLPMKYAAENAIRELEHHLGAALSTTDADHDATTRTRTMLALLHAPGTIRFAEDEVRVTLELPLPTKSHRRLAAALTDLDSRRMKFADGVRLVRFRLAERPTRHTVAEGLEAEPADSKSPVRASRRGKT